MKQHRNQWSSYHHMQLVYTAKLGFNLADLTGMCIVINYNYMMVNIANACK